MTKEYQKTANLTSLSREQQHFNQVLDEMADRPNGKTPHVLPEHMSRKALLEAERKRSDDFIAAIQFSAEFQAKIEKVERLLNHAHEVVDRALTQLKNRKSELENELEDDLRKANRILAADGKTIRTLFKKSDGHIYALDGLSVSEEELLGYDWDDNAFGETEYLTKVKAIENIDQAISDIRNNREAIYEIQADIEDIKNRPENDENERLLDELEDKVQAIVDEASNIVNDHQNHAPTAEQKVSVAAVPELKFD